MTADNTLVSLDFVTSYFIGQVNASEICIFNEVSHKQDNFKENLL